MAEPLSPENLRRLDRYCPKHAPYQRSRQLGAPDRVIYGTYARSIISDLLKRKNIKLSESHYLFFFGVILKHLGERELKKNLEKAVSSCKVIDADKVHLTDADPSVPIPGLSGVRKVNWRFLPNPASLSSRELLDILKQHFAKHSGKGFLHFEIDRIEFALTLEPEAIFVGLEEFAGYYAFTFPGEMVLFECPAYGNAAYVVKGDWRLLSQQFKAQLERQGARIIHNSGSWRWRVKQALKTASKSFGI